MCPELRWGLVGLAAVAFSVFAAEPYARLMRPYYECVARVITATKPWQILDVSVGPGESSPGSQLKLTGTVRRNPTDPAPAAMVVSKLHVGATVQLPVTYWLVVLAWSAASARACRMRFLWAIPMYFFLETITTVAQLLASLDYAAAMLNAPGDDPVTLWEHWSRFIEAGGRIALALSGGLLVVAVSSATKPAAIPAPAGT